MCLIALIVEGKEYDLYTKKLSCFVGVAAPMNRSLTYQEKTHTKRLSKRRKVSLGLAQWIITKP